MPVAIGLDLGGTNIKGGIVDENGKVLVQGEVPTLAHEGPDKIVGRMAKLAEEMRAKAPTPPVGVGVGSPGPLDQTTGMLYHTPNMPGWENYQLGAKLAEKLNLKVTVDNDANVAALAEFRWGAAKGTKTMILLTLGTGIGGGVIFNGALVNGPRVTAGEVGHIIINDKGPKCGCGNHGCLEAYCGTQGILSRAKALLDLPGTVSILREMGGRDYEKLTPAMLSEAALKGDGVASSLLKETGRLLGVGVASLVNLFAPEVVVIGGGVARAGEFIFSPLREEVRRRAMRPASEWVKVVPAAMGNDAGLVGAAALVLGS